MEYYNNNFSNLKNRNAFRLTDPIFDDCRDSFRVGCFKKVKYGYILFCMNLQKDEIVTLFSNTKLKDKIDNTQWEEVKENLYVPTEAILFSTFGYKNSKYLENTYRKVFFL